MDAAAPPPDECAAVAERYDRFARLDAPGRSELYRQWAAGVAADPDVQAVLARIPATRRQPPLVFAVSRLLGAPERPYPAWREWVLAHADPLVAEASRRALQTNEPQRCTALLPALSLIPGPLALIELGASAGLCLYPDRYAYRYTGDDGAVCEIAPAGGSTVTLGCRVRGARGGGAFGGGTGALPDLALPEVVWRAGIDLHPLHPADPDTRRWLTTLVWPGEVGRAARIGAAVDIAAADPPARFAGDAADLVAAVAAGAPRGATVVVMTPGLLPHVPRARRAEVIAAARAAGRWVTLDAPTTHDGWTSAPDPAADGFALALDGAVIGRADPLGAWLEWHPGSAPPRG